MGPVRPELGRCASVIDDDNAPLFADVPRHNSSEADEEESTWAFLAYFEDQAYWPGTFKFGDRE